MHGVAIRSCFINSRFGSLSVLQSTGSPNVAVGLLAYTFLREVAFGWHATQFPCVKLQARIAARTSNNNSEQLKDDWEHGTIQSCMLSQDPESILGHSEKSLNLVRREFEP